MDLKNAIVRSKHKTALPASQKTVSSVQPAPAKPKHKSSTASTQKPKLEVKQKAKVDGLKADSAPLRRAICSGHVTHVE